MELELATMPFIILTVYLIVWLMKKFILKTDKQRQSLPPIAMIMGGTIAVLLFYFMPDTVEFTNIIEALTTGMGSGLAAVGCNQVYKQFQKFRTVTNTCDDCGSDIDESI